MRRSWNIAFLLGRAARWSLALVVLLPLGTVLGVALLAIWLIWLAVSALHGLLLRFETSAAHPPPAASGAHRISPAAGQRRTLDLPVRSHRRVRATETSARRHSLEDLQRSISAMARHGWPKSKVIETLESAGAARMWSQRVADESPAAATRPVSGERVHLRYRPGNTVLQRYTMPAARIDVFFDQAGRMVRGFAHQDRRM